MTGTTWRRWLALGAFAATALVSARAGNTYVKLLPSDGAAGALFGISTAIDGQTAVVGSWHGGDGAAYVYTRSGGAWPQQRMLTPDAAGGSMGDSVAIAGDTIVAGAPQDSTVGAAASGAYVFVRTGTTWTQQAKLLPADPQTNGYFGGAVAIDGDTVVVGAWSA
jgi:hypothetical protein